MRLLIGISGKLGTGKSTVAAHIMKRYPNAITEKVAGDLYAIQDYIYERTGLTLQGEKDRDLLIAIGMWGRSKSSSLWTDLCFNRIAKSEAEVIIVDDIRFPEEAKALEDAGGVLIRIEGEQRGPNVTPQHMNSTSETALDNYNFKHRISNLVPISEMMKELDKILGTEE